MPVDRPLTPKEAMFVLEYLKDFKGAHAAARAGYKGNQSTLQTAAWKLLKRSGVQAALSAAIERRREACEISADRVVRELALLGFSNMTDYVAQGAPDQNPNLDLRNITRDQAAAIQELTIDTIGPADGPTVLRTKIKLSDKRGALELLGKHLGVFKDAPAGAVTFNIITGIPDEADPER